MTDRQRLQRLRRLLLARLSELEAERKGFEEAGDTGLARGSLRVFQELTDLLEIFDENLES